MTTNTDPVRAHDELRVQAALLRTPEFMAQFDPDKFAGQLERIAAALAGSEPQRYDIDADPNGIRADVTRCVRAALYCGANNVNPPPEGHWLRDFWLIGRAEASRQDALAAQQQGQAVAECHCATCTCAPGMTPAVRFDTSPAAREGAIRDHLIALGWTPPGAPEQQPASPSGAVNVVGMPEFDGLMDHIYEYGTTAEGVVERANAFARAVLAQYAPQQPAAVNDAMVDRAGRALYGTDWGSFEGWEADQLRRKVRAVLTAALAQQQGGAV